MSDPAVNANPEPPATVLPRRLAGIWRATTGRSANGLRGMDRQRLSELAPRSMPMPAESKTIASIIGLPASRKRLKP